VPLNNTIHSKHLHVSARDRLSPAKPAVRERGKERKWQNGKTSFHMIYTCTGTGKGGGEVGK